MRLSGQACFSPDAELVLTIGASGFHCVAIYHWQSASLIFSAHASENAVLDATWASATQFVTCGVNHVHFWTKEGAAYRRQRGLFGKKVLLREVQANHPPAACTRTWLACVQWQKGNMIDCSPRERGTGVLLPFMPCCSLSFGSSACTDARDRKFSPASGERERGERE